MKIIVVLGAVAAIVSSAAASDGAEAMPRWSKSWKLKSRSKSKKASGKRSGRVNRFLKKYRHKFKGIGSKFRRRKSQPVPYPLGTASMGPKKIGSKAQLKASTGDEVGTHKDVKSYKTMGKTKKFGSRKYRTSTKR